MQWKRCQTWKWDFGGRSFLGSRKKDGEREKIQNLYLSKIPLILLSHQPSYCLKSTRFPHSHELLKATCCCARILCYYPLNEDATYVTVNLQMTIISLHPCLDTKEQAWWRASSLDSIKHHGQKEITISTNLQAICMQELEGFIPGKEYYTQNTPCFLC